MVRLGNTRHQARRGRWHKLVRKPGYSDRKELWWDSVASNRVALRDETGLRAKSGLDLLGVAVLQGALS